MGVAAPPPPPPSPRRGEGGRVGEAAYLLSVQKASQLLGTTRVAELAQCLRLYLANPLARDVELLAHFLEGVVGIHLNAETHAQHFGIEMNPDRSPKSGVPS